MKYEFTCAQQTLKRATRHLCIEVPQALTEHELHLLTMAVDEAPHWPRVALDCKVRELCGGRAYWDERPRDEKEAA